MKKTCNRADAARMHKLADKGDSISEIVKKTRVEEATVRKVLKGREVRKDMSETVETEVVDVEEAATDPVVPTPPPAPAPAAVEAAEETPGFLD